MKLFFLLFPLLIVPWQTFAVEESDSKYEDYLIQNITVVSSNVFNVEDPTESGFLARLGNAFHVVTREDVLRSELLFHEGEKYDPLVIAESERKLREVEYLSKVQIEAVFYHKRKMVDIIVHTSDQWSLVAGGTLGGTDENTETGLTTKQMRTNIFWGQSFSFGDNGLGRSNIVFSAGKRQVWKNSLDPDESKDNKLLFLTTFLFNPHDFAKERYIEKYRIVEDIALGSESTVLIGKSDPVFGATTSEFSVGVRGSRKYRFYEKDYLFTFFTLDFNDESFNDLFFFADVTYYFRRYRWHNLVLHADVSFLRSDTNFLTRGGTKGLRGFKSDEFKGKKAFIFNLEERVFTFKSLFYGIVEPGFLLFSDWGMVFGTDDANMSHVFNGSVGVGLRLALLKAPGINLVRIDVGVPVIRRSQPVVTVGMEGFF